MTPDPSAIREVLIRAGQIENEQTRKAIPSADPRYLPWMPFQIPEFVALLAEAIPATPGTRFLGIGAGPGTKELLARDIFGLDPTCLEINPELAAVAQAAGMDVVVGDALDFTGYGAYDLIWFYRPVRDPDLQAALEKAVWDGMSPGAVAVCAALESPPPQARFWPVLEDLDRPRGIWCKLPPS
jgi:SAM-dependent methyltransferase